LRLFDRHEGGAQGPARDVQGELPRRGGAPLRHISLRIRFRKASGSHNAGSQTDASGDLTQDLA
jgi:hypothetical protein